MGRSKIILFLAATCVLQCSARRLSQITIAPAQAAPKPPLTNQTSPGIASFLQSNANYSIFLNFVRQDPVYSVLLSANWTQGVTNNTVLVPTNAAIEAGFKTLGSKYSVPSNPGQYLQLANASDLGNSFSDTPLNTALAQLISGILNSHISAEPINFYADGAVLGSNSKQPIPINAPGLDLSFATVAYNNGTSDNPRLVFAQPTGLLLDPVRVPEIYAQQVGSNLQGERTVLYLYEINGLFLASQVLKGAADGGSTLAALNTIKPYTNQEH